MQLVAESEAHVMAKDPTIYENVKIPELGGLTLAQAKQVSTTISTAIESVKATLLSPTVRYADDERGVKAAQAGFSEAEEKAFHATFDAADIAKGYLSDMADLDHGSDSSVFETDLQRARVEVYKSLRESGEKVIELGYGLIDTAISTALLARDVESNTYDLVKGLAKINSKVRSSLADAFNYFRSRVKSDKNDPEEKK
jgi:hypothetical protein